MSLSPSALPPIPDETARAAKAAFKKGNVYLTIGDQIGTVFAETDFRALYAADGAPAVSPVRLALVLIFAFMEDLADRAAADAVRSRIDWKYALHLPLDDAGFDASVLTDFRERLLQHDTPQPLFERLLARLVELNLLTAGGRQRTDATHVLAASRSLNRLELVAETMRLAVEALAEGATDWLKAIALAHWYERYHQVLTPFRLPRAKAKRDALALSIGADGFHVLDQLSAAPAAVAQLTEIQTLQTVWQQQFVRAGDDVHWRPTSALAPGAELIQTPHDVEARYSRHERKLAWTGYQIHLTETCDAARPHLISHVATTPAPTADVTLVEAIHADLAQADLLPQEHLMDSGYVAAHVLASSRATYGVEVVGPVAADTSWQAQQPDGICLAQFSLDWTRQQATCPMGQTSVVWSERANQYGQTVVDIRFAQSTCVSCPARQRCVRGTKNGRSLKVGVHYETLLAARARQQTPEYKALYKLRVGIEGTISAAVRRHGVRRSRYSGQRKTELQAVFTAMAINLHRAALWLMARRPKPRRSVGLACLAPTLLSA